MKKRIIIEAEGNEKVDSKEKINGIIHSPYVEWFIYMIGYAIVLLIASNLFTSFNIGGKVPFLTALLGAIIIYVLNKTIKPILITLTLPITLFPLGIAYPLVNVIILYITSFILGNRFNVSGFFAPLFISIIISVLNILMEGLVIKPIIQKGKNRR